MHAPGVALIDTAVLAAPLLGESSGVIASRRRPGVLWSINDSGNEPLLFATDSTGADLGRLTVARASNVDWEDISAGPCPRSSGTCLYIADTGDNQFQRRSVTIYVLPEPEPPLGPGDTARVVRAESAIELRFPDRPHDAEGLAVLGGHLLLVTKDRFGPAQLYRAPLSGTGPRLLEHVASLAMRTSLLGGRIVTGAAVSRNGRLLVVRTYVSLHLFSLDGTALAALTDMDGITIPVVETQGEAVCFDDAGRLILTSERGRRQHALLTRLRLTGVEP